MGAVSRLDVQLDILHILRKIFGPKKAIDGSGRIKTDEELDKLIP